MKKSFLIGLLLPVLYSLGLAGDFTWQGGLGYDYFSQEYFLDSAINSPDSLYSSFILQNTYLNDFRGYVTGSYAPDYGKNFRFSMKLEQSKEYFRVKSILDLNHSSQSFKYYSNTELDYRHGTSDSTENSGYLFGSHRSRIITPLSNSLALKAQFRSEFVAFDSTSTFNYNYYRIGGKIGIEKKIGLFSFSEINMTYLARQVEDSSLLNYSNYGTEARFSGLFTNFEIDLFTQFYLKDYNRLDDYYDYTRFELFGQNRVTFSPSIFSRQKYEIEVNSYNENDPVYNNFYEITGSVIFGYYRDLASIGAGLHSNWLREKAGSEDISEDYQELGLLVSGDILIIKKLLGSVESITGKRKFSVISDLYTDYTFEQLSFFSDITVKSNIHLTTLFSAEWEWHDLASNNSSIYLLSINLNYKL